MNGGMSSSHLENEIRHLSGWMVSNSIVGANLHTTLYEEWSIPIHSFALPCVVNGLIWTVCWKTAGRLEAHRLNMNECLEYVCQGNHWVVKSFGEVSHEALPQWVLSLNVTTSACASFYVFKMFRIQNKRQSNSAKMLGEKVNERPMGMIDFPRTFNTGIIEKQH